MKILAHYSIATFLFVVVLFSLLFMNVLSIIMLRKINQKEEEPVTESYFLDNYELSKL